MSVFIKKTNSDKLYAATKYTLYEISQDTIIILKQLALDPDIFSWFPLHVGNRWVYNTIFLGDEPPKHYITSHRITGTFLYNNNQYFQLGDKSLFTMCYRIDSTAGRIYKGHFYGDTLMHEELFLDLTADIGDTVGNDSKMLLESQSLFSQFGLNSVQNKYVGLATPMLELKIVKSLGVYYRFEWELVGYQDELKGAIINNTLYGDTTILGVDNDVDFPKSFSLFQNYPNPFNPSTTLEYQLPKRAHVTIKIFDVVGREVAVLVNEEKDAGTFKAIWNAARFSSGMYFARMSAASFVATKKLLLIK